MRRFILAMAVVVLAGAFANSAQAAVQGVALASRASGELNAFTVGPDDAVWTRAWSAAGGWGAWTSLGGTATAAPRAIGWGGGRLDVFVRGTDNAVYQKTYWPGSGWSAGWARLGGIYTSSIEAASPNVNRLDLLGRDTAGQLSMRTWLTGSGWSPWYQVHPVSSGVGAIWWRPDGVNDRLDVFAGGPGVPLEQGVFAGPAFSGWSWYGLDGVLTSDPDAAAPSNSRLDIVARGSDGNGYLKTWYAGTGWTTWSALGAQIVGGPQAVWSNDGFQQRLDIAALGTDRNIQLRSWGAATGWSGWYGIGTPPLPDGLVRERSSSTYYQVEDGELYPIASAAVAQEAGLDVATARVVTDGNLSGMPVGTTITSSQLGYSEAEPDLGTATAAGSSWKGYGHDDLWFDSGDGKATVHATIQWFHGKFPFAYRHRGDFTPDSDVLAGRPVGCIWAKVSWGYLTGSVGLPPNGSISGAQSDQGYFVKCKANGQSAPAPLSLYGLGWAKSLLASGTLTICTSATRAEGPKFCSSQKGYYLT